MPADKLPSLPRSTLLMLGALAALLPGSLDGFGPALPAVASGMRTSGGWAQATMSVFVLAFAGGQLLFGMLADRFGRRPVVIAGLALYTAGGLLAAVSGTIAQLLAARAVQGAGAAAAVLLSRTIVRDLLDREPAARALALIGAIYGTVPILAPIAAGLLVQGIGWQGPLIAMAVASSLLLYQCARRLPETLKERDPAALSASGFATAAAMLMRSPRFLGYVLPFAFAYASVLLFASTASLIMIPQMGISPALYGPLFSLAVSGFMVGNLLSSRLVARWGVDRTLAAGLWILIVGSVLMTVAAAAAPAHWLSLVLPMIICSCGWGVAQPQMQAGALSIFPQLAGRASAMLGFAQQIIGGTAVALFAQFGATSALRLGMAMIACAAAAMVTRRLGHRR